MEKSLHVSWKSFPQTIDRRQGTSALRATDGPEKDTIHHPAADDMYDNEHMTWKNTYRPVE
jgi:hypothetical protein